MTFPTVSLCEVDEGTLNINHFPIFLSTFYSENTLLFVLLESFIAIVQAL